MWEVVDSLTMATWAYLVESVVDNTPMVRWPSSGQLVRSKWAMSGQPGQYDWPVPVQPPNCCQFTANKANTDTYASKRGANGTKL